MAETPQLYLGLEAGSSETETGLRGVINYLSDAASSPYKVGNEFERLIKRYLSIDPLYKERFSDVWLWKEWTAGRTDFDATDIGIDLVARESSRRILRDSVQMLRGGHAGYKAADRFIHLRFGE